MFLILYWFTAQGPTVCGGRLKTKYLKLSLFLLLLKQIVYEPILTNG